MNEIRNFLSISKVSWEHSPFFNVLSMAVFILERQSWILVIGTIWPTESLKYTLSGPLQLFASSWYEVYSIWLYSKMTGFIF